MYRVCSPVSRSFTVQTPLSQNPHMRLFHTSRVIQYSSDNRKIDPSRYFQKFESSSFEASRITRKLEENFEKNRDPSVSKQSIRETIDKYWPTKDEDIASFDAIDPPLPHEQDSPLDYPIDPLDFNNDLDYAKGLSYLSNDQTFLHTKEGKEEQLQEVEPRFPVNEVLKISRHTHVTASGRVFSFSALVMLGTGKGTAGLGYARGKSVADAITLATTRAEKKYDIAGFVAWK